jgi:5-methylcytosine-specific restriction protein A
MPDAPLRPCAWAGCPRLTTGRYCDNHQQHADAQSRSWGDGKDRPSRQARGYDARWERVRRAHLRGEPLCRHCLPRAVPATVVHHIISIEDAPELRLEESNLMSLCRQCHEVTEGRARG